MKFSHVFWVICSVLAIAHGAPKPLGESADRGHKEIGDVEEGRRERLTTLLPEVSPNMSGDISDLPDNWDQSKDDSQSLFLNKSDKNDPEPYPMALADDAYDGQPIRADAELPRAGALQHVVMRAELYGEPPSAGLALRRKRAGPALRADLGATLSRVSKMAPRYSTINRYKRETNMRSEDILALLSLWEAQQRRNNEAAASSYYSPDNYYNQAEPFEINNPNDVEETDERWLNEPALPSHFSHNFYPVRQSIQLKPNRYPYPREFPEIIAAEPGTAFQNMPSLDALRRKRQWAGFGNRNRVAMNKRFMVKKRSPLTYRPHEDLYSLHELLRSSANRDLGIPTSRRMVL